MRSVVFVTLSAVALLAVSVQSASIESKCSACKAIGDELQYRIKNEKPRNHIDMRGRLDSKGNRYGKVIDYK